MRFTIVTPNLNGMPHLSRCIASVRDQPADGVEVEHIVADGGSTDASTEWLERQPSETPGYLLRWFCEPDRGMYDAIDKGWRRGTGDVFAWLNSDEQYLPDALSAVAAALAGRPEAGLIYGDALLIRPDDTLIAYRKAAPLRLSYLRAAHLYVHSSSLFVRRRWLVDENIRLDPSWIAAGDHEWMLRLLRGGARPLHVRRYLSAFLMTGHNLGSSARGIRELRKLQRREPRRLRALAPLLRVARAAEKYRGGGFRQRFPLCYQLMDADGRRITRSASHASWRWRTS